MDIKPHSVQAAAKSLLGQKQGATPFLLPFPQHHPKSMVTRGPAPEDHAVPWDFHKIPEGGKADPYTTLTVSPERSNVTVIGKR